MVDLFSRRTVAKSMPVVAPEEDTRAAGIRLAAPTWEVAVGYTRSEPGGVGPPDAKRNDFSRTKTSHSSSNKIARTYQAKAPLRRQESGGNVE
jgi:hypothetical protein